MLQVKLGYSLNISVLKQSSMHAGKIQIRVIYLSACEDIHCRKHSNNHTAYHNQYLIMPNTEDKTNSGVAKIAFFATKSLNHFIIVKALCHGMVVGPLSILFKWKLYISCVFSFARKR